LSQWKEGSHDSYLWIWVSRGVALDSFVCVVYVALVSSKHENESLFQNLAANIVEVQTLGGIVLLGRDFNVHTTSLPDTINNSDLCELLQALEFVEIEQPSVMAKQTMMLVLATRVMSSWTYVVMLGCSSSMVEHLVTN